MKTRQGFVSNSSSSSFVFLGWEIDRDKVSGVDVAKTFASAERLEKNSQQLFSKSWTELSDDEIQNVCADVLYELENEEDGIVFFDHEERGAPKGKSLLGKCLAISNEVGAFDNTCWTADEITTMLGTLRDKMGVIDGGEGARLLGITDDHRPILRVGMMMT